MVATGFSVHVRKSSHGHGKQVQVRILHSSLGGVNTKIALDTGRQPLHQPGSNEKYILPLQHMLKGFENKYPSRVNKQAIHPDLPDWLYKLVHRKGRLSHHQSVGDLEIIEIYYIL